MKGKNKKLTTVVITIILVLVVIIVLIGIKRSLTLGGEAAGPTFWWQSTGTRMRLKPLPTRENPTLPPPPQE